MSKARVFLGTIFGAVAGFTAGVLSAPKAGKETRKDLKNAAHHAKDVVVDEATKVRETTGKAAADIKRRAESTAHEVAHKASDLKEDTVERATELKGRVEQAVDGARKGFAKKPTKK